MEEQNKFNSNNVFDPVKVDDDYFDHHYREQEQFYAAVKNLPDSIVDILFGEEETSGVIKQIAEQHQLNPNQSAELSRLIRKVLVAEFYLVEIVNQMKAKLSIDEVKAKSIAGALVEKLFTPALEDIKKIHTEKFGKKETPPPKPPMPAASVPPPPTPIMPPSVPSPKPPVINPVPPVIPPAPLTPSAPLSAPFSSTGNIIDLRKNTLTTPAPEAKKEPGI